MTATRVVGVVVGHIIDGDDLHRLPIGTEVTAANTRWVKEGADDWAAPNGMRTNTSILRQHRCVLAALPGGEQRFTAAPPTLDQVKWEFRRGALAAARNHGVGIDMTIRTLERMEVGVPPLGNGVPVALADTHLPDGTVIFTGNPATPARFGVFHKTHGRWVAVLGELSSPGYDGVVDSVNGVRDRPAWLDEEGVEGDPQIAMWKAKAWRIGYALKREQRWCGVYEEVVRSLGISADDARRYPNEGQTPTAGQRVRPEEAALLPVGSLLAWRNTAHPERWALYARTENVANAAGTIRIGGTDESHDNYQRGMDVLGVANNLMLNWTVPDDPPGMVPHFPAGTWLDNSNGYHWTVAEDGRLWEGHTNRMHPQGTHSFDQFESEARWIVRRVVRQ